MQDLALKYIKQTEIADVALTGLCSDVQLERLENSNNKNVPEIDWREFRITTPRLLFLAFGEIISLDSYLNEFFTKTLQSIDYVKVSEIMTRKIPTYKTATEESYREELNKHIADQLNDQSALEIVSGFAKYAPRQDLTRFLARVDIFRMIKNTRAALLNWV